MQELFRKYLDNQCSPEEVKIVLAYFNNAESESVLRGLITESLTNSDEADDVSQWQPDSDKVFLQIKKQMEAKKGKIISLRKRWMQVAAAAILVTGGFWVYNSINSTSKVKHEIAKADTTDNEIRPGGNKAILTLNDGSVIDLETVESGAISEQGNMKVLKIADGQLAYKPLNEKSAPSLVNSVTTPKGGQYQLTLSDGSMVWLNAASSIKFPVTFTGRERSVEVTGEVYFEVATLRLNSGQKMPFKVKIANKAEVEVLGTHFNINAYNDEPTINTTLLEGSVKVTGLTHDESRIIVPGEQAELNANNQITINKQANVEQAIAWKNGIFNFDNANLEKSLRQIARWYNVDIIFEGPIPQKQFNGEMQRSLSISQVIKLLDSNNVRCRIEGRKLIVMK